MKSGILGILVFLAFHGSGFGFDHNVNPPCEPEDEQCVFDWVIDYTETMIYYGEEDGPGEPVVVRNGTLFRRAGCDNYIPLNESEYDKVQFADGSYKLLFSINGQIPGPILAAYEGQQVIVNIKNNLLMEGLTIHWHGMVQVGTPWMDGVGTISQCPINPGETFQYSFLASPEGTHWYHSHLGTERTDGLASALVILPRPRPPDTARKQNSSITASENGTKPAISDPEYSGDYVMVISDWKLDSSVEVKQEADWGLTRYSQGFNESVCYSATRGIDGGAVGLTNFESALINGKGQHYLVNEDPDRADIPELPHETFRVTQFEYFRFRVVNVGMMFAYRVSVDGHDVQVISTDGNDIKTEGGESVIVHTGERTDFMVYADAPVDNYWIRVETLETSNSEGPVAPHHVLGILSYDGAPSGKPTSVRRNCTGTNPCKVINCPYGQVPESFHLHCLSMADLRATDAEIERNPVPKFSTQEDFQELFLNFHFSSTANVPFTPAVNGHQFVTPSAPPQIYPTAPNSTVPCEELDCSDHCECTQIVKLELFKTTQVILVNMDDAGGGMPHPIHMHGHHFHVLKVGHPEYDPETGQILQNNPDIYCETPSCNKPRWKDETWKNGDVPGINLVDPPLKDTVIVPRGGYVVLRLMSSNPGFWFMHCHIEIHQIAGMAVLLQEGDTSDMAPTPPNFPTCGNFLLPENFSGDVKERIKSLSSHKVPKSMPPRRQEVEVVEEVVVEHVQEVDFAKPRVHFRAPPHYLNTPAPAKEESFMDRLPRSVLHVGRKEAAILVAFLALSVGLNIVLLITLCCRGRGGMKLSKTPSEKKHWFANNIDNFRPSIQKSESKQKLVTE